MLPLLLAAALAQAPRPAAERLQRPRDVATMSDDDGGPVRPPAELQELPDAELERRIAELARQNRRSYSDQRSIRIQELEAERERRAHEREWDAEERRRRAREEADVARAEAEHQKAEVRSREADEVAARAMAVARARAEAEEREAAELRERERRDARVRWAVLGGCLIAAAAAAGLALRARRRA